MELGRQNTLKLVTQKVHIMTERTNSQYDVGWEGVLEVAEGVGGIFNHSTSNTGSQ